MKVFLLALMVMIGTNARAQRAYDVYKDTAKEDNDGSLVFYGPITFNDLENEPTFSWLKSGYDDYKPAHAKQKFLAEHLKDYSIVVFMGTWCDDSHYIIPKFEKLLNNIGYPLAKVTMYGVDRQKTTKNGADKTYGITRVPTIILFRNGKEAGRITETVVHSIEADLEAIIKKDTQAGK